MKEIKAIVQPFKLTKLRNALRHIAHFPGMSVTRVEGFGHLHEDGQPHSIKEELTDFSPKVRIEIVAPDHQVEEIVRILTETAHTGQKGDGLVWVTAVEQFAKISHAAGDEPPAPPRA